MPAQLLGCPLGCLAVVRYWLGESYYVTRNSERKRQSRQIARSEFLPQGGCGF